MATALVSLLTGRPVRDDVAMTGEITLTGQVLPIGGLKEKALAAQRNGITRVIAPALNEPDVEEIPEHLRNDLEFVCVEEIGEVLEWRSRRRPRPTAAGARVQPHRAGYRLGTGQQATSGDRGMAAKKQAAKARSAATGASPYVQRVIEDAELRENVRTPSSRQNAYGRLTNGKPPTKVLDDKKLQKDSNAAESLRDAGRRCARAPRRRRSACGFAKLLFLAIVGAGVASPLARACARRCSTPCSAPRRSSTTRRPRRPRRPRRARRCPRTRSRPLRSRRATRAPRGAPFVMSRDSLRSRLGWPAS